MDAAEKVVSSNADSALRILDSIPASKIRGKEARARYALLKSIVLDKNYIDKTTFEVLQPAIDYYPENGSCDEKLRIIKAAFFRIRETKMRQYAVF